MSISIFFTEESVASAKCLDLPANFTPPPLSFPETTGEGAGSGAGAGTDAGTGSGAGAGAGAETGAGTGSGAGAGMGADTEADAETGTGAGAGAETGTVAAAGEEVGAEAGEINASVLFFFSAEGRVLSNPPCNEQIFITASSTSNRWC